MSNVKDRLLRFIQRTGISTAEFERSIGVSGGYVSNISKSIQPDKLEIISKVYPALNIEWLLIDTGKMIKPHRVSSFHLTAQPYEESSEGLAAQRIKDIIQYLNTSIGTFAEKIDISQDYLSNALEGGQESGTKLLILQSIIKSFDFINPEWLILGEGSMLKSETQTPNIPKRKNEDNSVNYKLVPLLNLDAVGGMHSLNSEPGDNEYIDKLIPFTDAQDGDVALMVSGESMSPTCPSGSKILIREVPKWNEYFGYGNIFVLLLTDGRRVLKEVQKWQEDSKNYILCRSHNDKYPEEELPKSMIAGVWKVIKILNERGW